MPLWRTSNKLFKFERRTNELLSEETLSTSTPHTLDRQLPTGGILEITLGTTGGNAYSLSWSGTLTDESGSTSSVSETLVISGNKTSSSMKIISDVSSGISATAVSSHTTSPTIKVEAIHSDGSAMEILYTVADDRPAQFTYMQMRGAADFSAETAGGQEADWAKILLPYESAWKPRVGDVITDKNNTSETWVVRAVRPIEIGYGFKVHHWEIRCTRTDT